jgi:hypothetical protein
MSATLPRALRMRPVLVLLVVLAGAAAGCNFFRPDTPPPPGDAPPPFDYSQPEQTLETLKLAIEDKRSISAGNYIGVFADSTLEQIPGYHQYFVAEDALLWAQSGRNVPEDWNVRLERRFFDVGPTSLINVNPNAIYEVTFSKDPEFPDREGFIDPFGRLSTILHRHYQILAIDPNSNEITEVIAYGFADLTFHQAPGGDWRITRWDDRRDLVPNPYQLPQVTWGQRRLESQ